MNFKAQNMTFEGRLAGMSSNMQTSMAAMMGFSASGRYHYLDDQLKLAANDKNSNTVIIDVDSDVLLKATSPDSFYRYMTNRLMDSITSTDDTNRSFPDTFDKSEIVDVARYVYAKMRYGNMEVLYTRLITMLKSRGLHIAIGDSSRRLRYTIQLHLPKYVRSSLWGLASAMYNWTDEYGVSELILTDNIESQYRTQTDGVKMDIYLREFGIMNAIVHDPHVKTVDDINKFSTEYQHIQADYYHLIMYTAIMKWFPPDNSPSEERTTIGDFMMGDIIRLQNFFVTITSPFSIIDDFKKLPDIGSLLFEKDGSYFKEQYNLDITHITGWKSAYSVMKWMNIYAKISSIVSIYSLISRIYKKHFSKEKTGQIIKNDKSHEEMRGV